MKTSLAWIKAYVPDLDVTPQQYVDGMTLSGTKVEGYERQDENLDQIVIGEIMSVTKHPNADRLQICKVNIGGQILQIVTGAQNVFAGAKVPVVLAGGMVAGKEGGGVRIQKGMLRGVESEGMFCSIEELGSTKEMYPEAPQDGIYIFPQDAVIGDNAVEALGLNHVIFEYEITSNRVDCFSVLGIAREAAATFGKAFSVPQVKQTGNRECVENYIKVEVKRKDLCPRYCARVIKEVKIAPSPKWLQDRLRSVGIRPINNLVDITNYVMEEYGQPMHAYDLETIAEKKIVVDIAHEGESFVTLDGQKHMLDHHMLMIQDGRRAIGIAGIMGGENSKIQEHASLVLLEAACFQGTNIRLSSKRLGLRTEASGLFEKGLDPNHAEAAMERACQLIEEIGAGEVIGGMIDICSEKREPERILFEPERINALLGVKLCKEEMLEYFENIGLSYDKKTNEVIVPTFRQDLHLTADLAEEVARFYGYDKIPETLPTGETAMGKTSFLHKVEELARETAECCGFSQGMCYSFEGEKVFDRLRLQEDSILRNAIPIRNPLGEEYKILRTVSLNGILTSLALNAHQRNENVRLYELGNIYLPKSIPIAELPEERMQFTLGMYGEGDFYTMKGVVELFLQKLGMRQKKSYDPHGEHPFFHPGRQADILYEGERLGYLGEVHPQVADHYDLKERVYIAVLDLPAFFPYVTLERICQEIPKYPAVTRDLSIIVDKEILAGEIEDVIVRQGGQYLESCRLFDLYEGAQIKQGFRSLAYTLTFRAPDKTLTEAEVSLVMEQIQTGLMAMGVAIRQ